MHWPGPGQRVQNSMLAPALAGELATDAHGMGGTLGREQVCVGGKEFHVELAEPVAHPAKRSGDIGV